MPSILIEAPYEGCRSLNNAEHSLPVTGKAEGYENVQIVKGRSLLGLISKTGSHLRQVILILASRNSRLRSCFARADSLLENG